MAESCILSDLPPKEHQGSILRFGSVSVNIFISPLRDYIKPIKIKGPVMSLM